MTAMRVSTVLGFAPHCANHWGAADAHALFKNALSLRAGLVGQAAGAAVSPLPAEIEPLSLG